MVVAGQDRMPIFVRSSKSGGLGYAKLLVAQIRTFDVFH